MYILYIVSTLECSLPDTKEFFLKLLKYQKNFPRYHDKSLSEHFQIHVHNRNQVTYPFKDSLISAIN